jgi:hypothetical protein
VSRREKLAQIFSNKLLDRLLNDKHTSVLALAREALLGSVLNDSHSWMSGSGTSGLARNN